MTSKKVFFGMLGAVVLVTGLTVGSIVVGSSMLKKKSAELVELKLQDRLIEEQQVALVQASKDIEKYQELESISKTIVPQDKDQAKTVREIITLGDQSSIKISSITFPTSTLGTTPPSAAPSTSSGGTTTTPKVQTPPLSQVKPVDGIPGLFQLEVTINVDEIAPTYNQLIDFLSRLEQNRRTAQVTSISINPSGANRNLVEFNLTMNVFVKP
jgi:hypothetical protein